MVLFICYKMAKFVKIKCYNISNNNIKMSWDQNEAEKEKKLVGQFGIHWVSITFTQTEKKTH